MIKRIITFFFLLIALIALTLLITLIPEILGAELTSEKGQGFLLVVFGENYSWWLFLILVLAIAVLFFFTPDQIKVLLKREEKPIALTPEETQKSYDTIRQYLRQRYERRKGQKLAGDQLFNLRIEHTTEGTSPEKADTFITLQGKKTGTEIQQIFEKARRRLLVTGLPGAGKTSLLLNLALELLETAPENLAVLLNLATWRSDFPSFDDWLRKILPAELGVTKRYAAEILQKGQLTLLLDGLDEVAGEHRASCLKAIGEYGRLGCDYVISTRKDEYKALEKDAPVWAQIEVLPLTDKQLLAQLDHADRRDFPEAPDLKAALEHDPLLLRVAETPFYLNCLQLLFRGGNTLSELKLKGTTVEERQAEITERFVEQALRQKWKDKTPEEVRHWLAFLASRMTQRNKVMFELVDLQYDWWRWGGALRFLLEILNSSLLFPHFFIPIISIFYYLIGDKFKWSFVFVYYFAFFITFRIIIELIKFISKNKYANAENLRYLFFESISTLEIAKTTHKWSIKTSTIWFFSTFLVVNAFLVGSTIFNGKNISIEFIKGAILSGVILGAMIGIGQLHEVERTYSSILQISNPYERYIASAKNWNLSILQHWLLRWQLYRAGVLPLRLVHFLNEMTARHLLETDGATWRFRHRILQEYFAKQWQEPKT